MIDFSITEAAISLVICPYCNAPMGGGCKTAVGGPAPVHMLRIEPIVQAYGAGYSEGCRDYEATS